MSTRPCLPRGRGSFLLAGLGLGLLVAPAYAAGGFAGDPLTPGTSAAQPASVGSGVYRVEASGGAEQYVVVPRTVEGSRIWFGASADVQPTADLGGGLTLQSTPEGKGAEPCNPVEGVYAEPDETGLRSGLFSTGRSAACRHAADIALRLRPEGLRSSDYQLVVWEEPPVQNAASLPRSVGVSWAPMRVAEPRELDAGSTFADAPVLPDGTRTVHVDPGATALFRVPLTWGQHAQVEAVSFGSASGFAQVSGRWLTPLGGAIADTAYSQGGPASHQVVLDGRGEPAGWVTPVVAWGNRGSGSTAPAAFAGDYYLSIDTRADDAPAEGVDLTLTARTVTDYAGTAPAYTQDPPPLPSVDGTAGAPATTTASDAAQLADHATSASPSGSSTAVGIGLLAVAALLAVGGALALRGRTP